MVGFYAQLFVVVMFVPGACLNLLAFMICNFGIFPALYVPVVIGILSCGASIGVPTNSVYLTRTGC
jgi:hypothetical protein